MTCEEWRPRIEAERLGALEPELSRELARHLESCEACRRYLEEAAAMEGALDSDTARVCERLDWPVLARRIRRASRWELRRLLYTSTLLAATVAAAIALDPGLWWTVGLLLFVLPIRIGRFLEDRRARARIAAETGDWLAWYRRSLDREWARAFVGSLVAAALGGLFALLALVGRHPVEAGIAAAVMLALALYRSRIRAARLRREIDTVGAEPA